MSSESGPPGPRRPDPTSRTVGAFPTWHRDNLGADKGSGTWFRIPLDPVRSDMGAALTGWQWVRNDGLAGPWSGWYVAADPPANRHAATVMELSDFDARTPCGVPWVSSRLVEMSRVVLHPLGSFIRAEDIIPRKEEAKPEIEDSLALLGRGGGPRPDTALGLKAADSKIGSKFDQDKTRWDLLPVGALRSIADVLAFGAAKYSEDNWKRVPNWRRRYYRAALGHLLAWWGGEDNDPESGYPHLAHAACCVLFLLELEASNGDHSP